jgi:hypothetical protein
MSMEPKVPATRDQAAPAEGTPAVEPSQSTALVEREDEASPSVEPRQNLTVALLPFALITFLVLSFIAAAWTFIAAT